MTNLKILLIIFFIVVMLACGKSETGKSKSEEKSPTDSESAKSGDNSLIDEVKGDQDADPYEQYKKDKDVILLSKDMEEVFVVRKSVEGKFMKSKYTEQLKIEYGKCKLDAPKTIGQSKISLFTNSLQYGDWDRDGDEDLSFMYRINSDGVDFVIVYLLISDCHLHVVENVFYHDEDYFTEEYEEEVSHIEDIQNAQDYYIRNFYFQIDKLANLNGKLKDSAKQNFKKFVLSGGYKEVTSE